MSRLPLRRVEPGAAPPRGDAPSVRRLPGGIAPAARRLPRPPRSVVLPAGMAGSAVAAGLVATAGLMWGEMKLAERRIPKATEPHPRTDDTTWVATGVSHARPPIRMAILGDSTAVGYGVDRDDDTPGARIALGVSEAARRPVHVTSVAAVGAVAADLPGQLDRLDEALRAQLRPRRGGPRNPLGPDLAVIMIGANDVTAQLAPQQAVVPLEQAVAALVARGAEVVVGTCPDLGTIRPISQPLRAYARRLSRRMAREQTVAVVRAGGRTVSLGDLLGPMFASRLELFSADRFHPSAAGYAEAAGAILPSALDALGLRTRARAAGPFTTRGSKRIERAAAQAVSRPGSEVAASDIPPLAVRAGIEPDGAGHIYARLRRRRRTPSR